MGTNRTVTAIASKNSSAVQIPKDKLIKEFKDTSILIKAAVLRSTYLRLTNLDSTIKNDLDSLKTLISNFFKLLINKRQSLKN